MKYLALTGSRRTAHRPVALSVALLFCLAAAALQVQVAQAAPGDLDPSFGAGGKATLAIDGFDQGMAGAIDGQGRIIVTGHTDTPGERDVGLARFTAGGLPDPGFGGGTGYVTRDPSPAGQDFVDDLAIQPDGMILIGGSFDGHTGILRHRTDGLPDTGFGTGGMVKHSFGHPQRSGGLILLPDGKIHWYGRGDYPASDLDLARFNSNGSLDAGFASAGLARHSLSAGLEQYHVSARLPDGKLLIAGETGNPSDWRIARLNPDGTLDPAFGSGGTATTNFAGDDYLYDIVIQPDGKIVAVGVSVGTWDLAVARYLPDGQLDPSFNGTGKVTVNLGGNDTGYAAGLQQNGKIVIAGETNATGVSDDMFVTRLNPDGSIDPSFGTGGSRIIDFEAGTDEARDLLIQPEGAIVLVGSATISGSLDFAAVRIEGDPVPSAAPPPLPIAQDSTVRLRILGKRLRLNRKGVARLRLHCPASEATPPCRGRVSLRTARKVRVPGKGRARGVAKARRLQLAQVNFRIGAGRTKVVRIKLGRAKMRILRQAPAARRVLVIANVRDGAGNRATLRKRMALR